MVWIINVNLYKNHKFNRYLRIYSLKNLVGWKNGSKKYGLVIYIIKTSNYGENKLPNSRWNIIKTVVASNYSAILSINLKTTSCY